jgi:hypothetical protein
MSTHESNWQQLELAHEVDGFVSSLGVRPFPRRESTGCIDRQRDNQGTKTPAKFIAIDFESQESTDRIQSDS